MTGCHFEMPSVCSLAGFAHPTDWVALTPPGSDRLKYEDGAAGERESTDAPMLSDPAVPRSGKPMGTLTG